MARGVNSGKQTSAGLSSFPPEKREAIEKFRKGIDSVSLEDAVKADDTFAIVAPTMDELKKMYKDSVREQLDFNSKDEPNTDFFETQVFDEGNLYNIMVEGDVEDWWRGVDEAEVRVDRTYVFKESSRENPLPNLIKNNGKYESIDFKRDYSSSYSQQNLEKKLSDLYKETGGKDLYGKDITVPDRLKDIWNKVKG